MKTKKKGKSSRKFRLCSDYVLMMTKYIGKFTENIPNKFRLCSDEDKSASEFIR